MSQPKAAKVKKDHESISTHNGMLTLLVTLNMFASTDTTPSTSTKFHHGKQHLQMHPPKSTPKPSPSFRR